MDQEASSASAEGIGVRHLLVTDSDIIHSVGFEVVKYLTCTLEVVFKSDTDTVYRYENVEATTVLELLSAKESIGKTFHEKFRKTKFPFTKSMRTELDKITNTKTIKK